MDKKKRKKRKKTPTNKMEEEVSMPSMSTSTSTCKESVNCCKTALMESSNCKKTQLCHCCESGKFKLNPQNCRLCLFSTPPYRTKNFPKCATYRHWLCSPGGITLHLLAFRSLQQAHLATKAYADRYGIKLLELPKNFCEANNISCGIEMVFKKENHSLRPKNTKAKDDGLDYADLFSEQFQKHLLKLLLKKSSALDHQSAIDYLSSLEFGDHRDEYLAKFRAEKITRSELMDLTHGGQCDKWLKNDMKITKEHHRLRILKGLRKRLQKAEPSNAVPTSQKKRKYNSIRERHEIYEDEQKDEKMEEKKESDEASDEKVDWKKNIKKLKIAATEKQNDNLQQSSNLVDSLRTEKNIDFTSDTDDVIDSLKSSLSSSSSKTINNRSNNQSNQSNQSGVIHFVVDNTLNSDGTNSSSSSTNAVKKHNSNNYCGVVLEEQPKQQQRHLHQESSVGGTALEGGIGEAGEFDEGPQSYKQSSLEHFESNSESSISRGCHPFDQLYLHHHDGQMQNPNNINYCYFSDPHFATAAINCTRSLSFPSLFSVSATASSNTIASSSSTAMFPSQISLAEINPFLQSTNNQLIRTEIETLDESLDARDLAAASCDRS